MKISHIKKFLKPIQILHPKPEKPINYLEELIKNRQNNGSNTNEKKQEDEKQKFDMENNNFNNSLSRYVQNTAGDASSVSGSSAGTNKGNRLKLSGREKLKEEEKLDFEKLKIFSNVITGINGVLLFVLLLVLLPFFI